ncbi:MAG: hypothetical protein V4563_00005, partial [Pseudomonadota bacterium]
MREKHWYKIETDKGKEGTYHYIGASSLSFSSLGERIQKGEFIRLDELLYMERGEIKEWADWGGYPRFCVNGKSFKAAACA